MIDLSPCTVNELAEPVRTDAEIVVTSAVLRSFVVDTFAARFYTGPPRPEAFAGGTHDPAQS